PASTIFRRIFVSIIKFCPRLFLADKPYFFRISCVLLGVAMSFCSLMFFLHCCSQSFSYFLLGNIEHLQPFLQLFAVCIADSQFFAQQSPSLFGGWSIHQSHLH